MDYEKKLALAKEALESGSYDKETIEYIFPELAKLKDEKIRKRILLSLEKDLIATKNSGCDTKDLEECIAWLEKQGEQKDSVVDFKAKDWYVSKVDGKIHNIYYSVDKVEPKFKVKYAGSEYNVLEIRNIAGVKFYGIEDEPNHIDYVLSENCERVGGYSIKENGSPYPTKPAVFSEQKPAWSEEDEKRLKSCLNILQAKGLMGVTETINTKWLKSLKERIKGK